MAQLCSKTALAVLVTAACVPTPTADIKPRLPRMSLESPAFADGQAIPSKHSCDGEDVSPELTWSKLPARTKSLALVVDDPDAYEPGSPKRSWVHWLVYDLPPDTGGLPEAVLELPIGAHEGRNDWGGRGYAGPCPAIGEHRYVHRLYALDAALGELPEPSLAELERAMIGHVLAEAKLVGTYKN